MSHEYLSFEKVRIWNRGPFHVMCELSDGRIVHVPRLAILSENPDGNDLRLATLIVADWFASRNGMRSNRS